MKINDVHIHVTKFSEFSERALRFMGRSGDFVEYEKRLEGDPGFLIEHLDREGVERAVLINYVAPDVIGFTHDVNRFIHNYAREYPDRLVPFGSLDPKTTSDIRGRLEEIVHGYELRGLKIHPVHQLLYPNQYLGEYGANSIPGLAAIYEFCEREGIPVTIHTGTSMFPSARNKYGDPIYIDDVAVDYPRLKIIMAHGGRPIWMKTAFYLLRRHSNVYLDISGIPPNSLLDYFPRIETIAEKVLFGSDWPSPGVKGIRENAEQVMKLPLRGEVKEMILRENFDRLFPR